MVLTGLDNCCKLQKIQDAIVAALQSSVSQPFHNYDGQLLAYFHDVTVDNVGMILATMPAKIIATRCLAMIAAETLC